jgi:hypothetical protein
MTSMKKGLLLPFVIFAFFCNATDASALQSEETALVSINERLQNPVSDLLSVSIENTSCFRYGPGRNETMDTLDFGATLPLYVVAGLDIIVKPDIPLVYVPWPEKQAGFGDMKITALLAGSIHGGISWGIGPVIGIPTATGDLLGTGRWTAGPSAALVYTGGNVVAGVTAYGLFSFAGPVSRGEVDRLYIKPFVYVNLERGWYMYIDPEFQCDYNLPSVQQWTVPLGGGIGKTFTAGRQDLSAYVSCYAKFEHPENASDLYMKAGLTLPFGK